MKTYDQMVRDILQELPSESDYLDYKQQSYAEKGKKFENTKKYELLKDIIAMANVQQCPADYRFIIIGISNERKHIGVEKSKCYDDASYQGLFGKIEPHLSVNTGVVDFHGKMYEYFCIKPEAHSVYTITEKCDFDSEGTLLHTAFVRRGSTTGSLTDAEIMQIKSSALREEAEKKTGENRLLQVQKIMVEAALLGTWDEKMVGDRDIISQIADMPYKEWVSILRNELHTTDSIFFQDGKWEISEGSTFIGKYGARLFDEDMTRLKEAAIQVLTIADPKYEAKPSVRWMSNEGTGYSAELTQGLSHMVAMVRYHNEAFSNCSNCFELAFVSSVLDSILKTDDWKVLATLDKNIQPLAEADPEKYLGFMEECVEADDGAWWHFLSESEPIWGSTVYGSGYFQALELLAIDENYFSKVCVILFKIAMRRKDVLRVLKGILLPQYPRTRASTKKRKTIFKKLFQLDKELSWELLYQLLPVRLPGAICPIQCPRYLSFRTVSRPNTKKYQDDCREICNYYENKAVALAEGDVHKIARLIDVSMRFYAEPFTQLVKLLKVEQKKKHSDAERYFIWNRLLSYTCQLRRHGGDFSNRSEQLYEVADEWIPQDAYYQAKRVFDESRYAVVDEKSDAAAEFAEYKRIRKEWLEKLFHRDRERCVLRLCAVVANAADIGVASAGVSALIPFMDASLAEWLNEKDEKYLQLARGYIWERQLANPEGVVRLLQDGWSDEVKLNFMTALPLKRNHWEMAERVLSAAAYKAYWEKQQVNIDLLTSTKEVDYAVQQFLRAKQWKKALLLAGESIYNNIPCSAETMLGVLSYPHIPEFDDPNSCMYLVKKLFRYLASHDTEKATLFSIAWRWYDLLEEEARILSDFIADDPHLFMMLLVILYNPDNCKEFGIEQVTSQLQQRCFTVLEGWKTVPGVHEGKIDLQEFQHWMDEFDKEKERYGVTSLADSRVGGVLFYSIDWDGELFLPKKIADFLEDDNRSAMREGFFLTAINSLGAHIIDAEGSTERNLAMRYGEKAEQMDDEGYVDVADMLRRIQSYFKKSADEIIYRFHRRQFI